MVKDLRKSLCVDGGRAGWSKSSELRMRTTISLSEFADMLGVYKLIAQHDAPPLIRIGRRVLIRREAAERWLTEREGRHAASV